MPALPARAGPVVLCGICWGAVVAHEMALQLAAKEGAPALLVLVDPILGEQTASGPRGGRRSARIQILHSRLQAYGEALRPLSAAARVQWVGAKAWSFINRVSQREPLIDTRVELEQRRVTNANLAAHANYRPDSYSGRSAILLTARPNPQGVDAGSGRGPDPRLAWLRLLPADTAVVNIPGENTGEAVSGANATVLATEITCLIAANLERG